MTNARRFSLLATATAVAIAMGGCASDGNDPAATPTGVARLTGASPTAFDDVERVVVTSADRSDRLVEAVPS